MAPSRHPPVLFLDIDGVLNRTAHATHVRVDDDLVALLRGVVQSTDCVIVLSTYWRPFFEYLRYVLARFGIKRVIDRTPGGSGAVHSSSADEIHYACRAAEIEAWLGAHPDVERFAILDDRPSASNERLAPHFVRTDSAVGMSADNAARCKLLLLGNARM